MPETSSKGRSERREKTIRSETGNSLAKEQSKTTTDDLAGNATQQGAHNGADNDPSTSAQDNNSELLKFGAILCDSIKELKESMTQNFSQLHQSLTEQYDDENNEGGTSEDDLLASDPENDHEPPNKRARPTTADQAAESSEGKGKRKVLTSIAEKLQMQEKVDSDVDSQLSAMINKLMFRKEKPDEEKLKEKLNLILRPANCASLVTTKVDELIWQRLRPQTRSFDSRAQVAQTCIVKSVTLLTKMLDKALNLKDKIPDIIQPTTSKNNDNPEEKLQGEIDSFIQEGMCALEIMSFANYEVNARRRECIKPDLNEEYTSLFSASVPINQFLFGGDTSKRLEEIDKTNKVVKKAMGQSSYSKMRQYKGANSNKNRGRDQRSYSRRNNYSQRPFLGKHPSPSNSNNYQRHRKGGKGKESKN